MARRVIGILRMSKNIPTLIVVVLLAAVVASMMCLFQVRFTEAVVVTRFDKIKRVIASEDAGLHRKWPWPIERVHRFDTRLRSFETEFRQLGTRDQKTVILTAYATWRIQDAERFLKSLGREDAAGPKIQDLLENQVSIVLRSHPLSHLVNVDENEIKFSQIEAAFLAGIQSSASDSYGIEIVSVGIKRLGIPEAVTKEVFTRMKEERQKTIKQLLAEGEAEARKIRANAEEVSKKILARADALAKTIEGTGDAEAAKYYKVFAENRKLSDFLKKLETLQKIFESGQITMVMDAKEVVPFDILKEAGEPTGGQATENRDATKAAPGTQTGAAADEVGPNRTVADSSSPSDGE